MGSTGPIADRRNARGARSRAALLTHAIALASVEGLEGLTFGRLASDLGVSKGNIVTLFGTKSKLQLAVLDKAIADLEGVVIKTALALSPLSPLERLYALVDHWFALAEQCPYPGGPVMYAICSEFRARSGAVRDRIRFHRNTWDDVHLGLAHEAQNVGQLNRNVDAAQLVFELTAFQSAASIAVRSQDSSVYALARKCARVRIEAAAADASTSG